MRTYSIFNDVLGPIMRGPSSSHTAASHRIGFLARSLLGEAPLSARVLFDRDGSYGRVFRDQGGDRAFAAGLMGWDMTDDRFLQALGHAEQSGFPISFDLGRIENSDHPNAVVVELTGAHGRTLTLLAKSVGGGSLSIDQVQGLDVSMNGQAHTVLIRCAPEAAAALEDVFKTSFLMEILRSEAAGQALIQVDLTLPTPPEDLQALAAAHGVIEVLSCGPVLFIPQGEPLVEDGEDLLETAQALGFSMGRIARAYEAALLGAPEEDLDEEMARRWRIMADSINAGLAETPATRPLKLMPRSAAGVMAAEGEGRTALGGPHTRAAARALAVMHVNAGMGLVCAAPTGGSAGVLPAVLATLAEEKGLSEKVLVDALWAAAGVGLIYLMHGQTFAAESAGCQAEIGVAGAMAAAAAVEIAGGSARQAADAAAIALQNTMGMPCDLVQGAVEVPCHTRNAVAASSALVCADLILGGYPNLAPLPETAAASYEVGAGLPKALRCTSLGGLAVTPSVRPNRKP